MTVAEAVRAVRAHSALVPEVAVILGTGLGGLAALGRQWVDAGTGLARALGSAPLETAILVAIAIAIGTSINATILGGSRVAYAMAADGLFFRGVARLHPRWGTPTLAIGLQAAWSIALALTGTYAALIDTVVFADWIFFGLTVASVLVFRRRIPLAAREPGGFRTPLHPVLPVLFAVIAAGVVASVVLANPVRSAVGAAFLLAGVPAFLYWRSQAPSPGTEAKGRGERE